MGREALLTGKTFDEHLTFFSLKLLFKLAKLAFLISSYEIIFKKAF